MALWPQIPTRTCVLLLSLRMFLYHMTDTLRNLAHNQQLTYGRGHREASFLYTKRTVECSHLQCKCIAQFLSRIIQLFNFPFFDLPHCHTFNIPLDRCHHSCKPSAQHEAWPKCHRFPSSAYKTSISVFELLVPIRVPTGGDCSWSSMQDL